MGGRKLDMLEVSTKKKHLAPKLGESILKEISKGVIVCIDSF